MGVAGPEASESDSGNKTVTISELVRFTHAGKQRFVYSGAREKKRAGRGKRISTSPNMYQMCGDPAPL